LRVTSVLKETKECHDGSTDTVSIKAVQHSTCFVDTQPGVDVLLSEQAQ